MTRASCGRRIEGITSVEREDGWVVLFRGNDAVLRVQESHVQGARASQSVAMIYLIVKLVRKLRARKEQQAPAAPPGGAAPSR